MERIDAVTLHTLFEEGSYSNLRPGGSVVPWTLPPYRSFLDEGWEADVEVCTTSLTTPPKYVVLSKGRWDGHKFDDYGTAVRLAIALAAEQYEDYRSSPFCWAKALWRRLSA